MVDNGGMRWLNGDRVSMVMSICARMFKQANGCDTKDKNGGKRTQAAVFTAFILFETD